MCLSVGCGWGDGGDSAAYEDADGDGFDASVDCDDQDANIHPDAMEICDALDNDCDGEIDMEDPSIEGYSTWYVDVDSDGFGSADETADACEQPDATADNPDDCDDRDDDIHPDAMEICDDIDNDCDGAVDLDDPDLVGESDYFIDADGDGFGAGEGIPSCDNIDGYSIDSGDCDDGNAAVHPEAEEICGYGEDSDCDGEDPECEDKDGKADE